MTDDLQEWTNAIHQGDAVETMRSMPASSVHAVITSPPYFGLRDYGVDGQLGLEASVEEYVASLVEVGHAVEHVLRPDGNWWLNLGDTFGGDSIIREDANHTRPGDEGYEDAHTSSYGDGRRSISSLGRKNKLLVPHRVAIALQEAGWIVRGDITWCKPNGMPQSVKDRFTEKKEFLFHLTRDRDDYYFDLDPVREPYADATKRRVSQNDGDPVWDGDAQRGYTGEPQSLDPNQFVHRNGKNPGDWWEIPVASFPDAHFAVFPSDLIERPIKATVPETVCADCGAPRRRETEEVPLEELNPSDVVRPQRQRALERASQSDLTKDHFEALRAAGLTDADYGQVQIGTGRNADRVEDLAQTAHEVLGAYAREFLTTATVTTGWTVDCTCSTDCTAPGIVLDPFIGSGTTAKVAKQLGRRFIGIDLSPEYVAMAQREAGLRVDEPEEILEDGQSTLRTVTDQEGSS